MNVYALDITDRVRAEVLAQEQHDFAETIRNSGETLLGINLIGNAVKFTHEGEVVLRVAPASQRGAGAHEPTTPTLHFQVRDTGVGIPAEWIDQIFTPFCQVDTSTTRRYGGTGLGLAISRRLAACMGGAMWAESVLGQGSTFHFTAQFSPAPGAARATDELLGQTRISVLMDAHMPEMDGLEATRRIRATLPARRQPYIIAMTADVMDNFRTRGLEAGMNDFIAKPVRIDALAAALARTRHPSGANGHTPPVA